jgi:hypothetical protein
MNAVFVVVAGVDYEGSTPIRAFDEKYPAAQFAVECREYEGTRPPFPKGVHIDRAEIDTWSVADKAWRAAHPGGENGEGSDYFTVIEVPFGEQPSTAPSNDTAIQNNKGEQA